MEYANFERYVSQTVGEAHCNEYKHMLPGVHHALRERCVATLQLGFPIPETLDHVNKAARLPEKNYYRYIKFMREYTGKQQYTAAISCIV